MSDAPRTVVLTDRPERHLPPTPSIGLVLTATPRAARRLGPAARSLSAWTYRLAGRAGWRPAPRPVRERALRASLAATRDVDDVAGSARVAAPAVAELLRAGLGGEEVDAAVADRPRARSLLALTRNVRARLRAAGWLHPADAPWVAAEVVRAQGSEAHALWLGHVSELAPGERALVDRVAGSGSTVVLASPSGDDDPTEWWARRGWIVQRDAQDGGTVGECAARRFTHGPAVPAADARADRYPSQEAEVRGVLAEVKRQLASGAVRAEAIGLVARDERAYGPVVRAVAAEYGLPLDAPYAVALRDTRPGAWLALLCDAVRDDAPFEATARLLAHPRTAPGDRDAWRATWREARRARTSGVAAWSRLDARAAWLRWPRRASRGAHLARLEEVRAGLEVQEDAGGAARTDAEAARAALARRRVDGALPALAVPEDEAVERGAFLAEVQDLLGLLEVPATTGAGVRFGAPAAFVGARVEQLYVLGCAEGVLPAPVREDPVLDFGVRTALRERGLPVDDAVDAVRKEANAFAAALRAADARLVLTFPDAVDADAQLPSPYLARLGLEPSPAPVPPPASEREALARHLPGEGTPDGTAAWRAALASARRARRVEMRRESEAPFDVHDGVVGVPFPPAARTFSATQLLDLGQCAFKWFARRVLGAVEPEESEEELTPLQRGRLWHGTLERAVAAVRAEGVTRGEPARAAVAKALDDAFEAAEREVAPTAPSWPQRRRDHLEALRRAVAHPEFLPDDAEVVAVEAPFEGTWRGLPVTGRVDRIDRAADGLRLIDYKTSGSAPDGAQDARGKLTVDVQLPLYREVAAPAQGDGESVGEAFYFSLTKPAPLRARAPDDATLEALVDRMRHHLEAGSFPVLPDRGFGACRLCDLDPVCRRGPRLARKRDASVPEP